MPEARGIMGQRLGYDSNDVRSPYWVKMLRKVRKQEGVRSRNCLKAMIFFRRRIGVEPNQPLSTFKKQTATDPTRTGVPEGTVRI